MVLSIESQISTSKANSPEQTTTGYSKTRDGSLFGITDIVRK